MEWSQKVINGVGVLTVSGQIDAYSAPEVEKALTAIINDQGWVVVDLAAVDYVSSAGLRVLLAGLKQTRSQVAKAGDLRVVGLQPQVKEVFDIAGFTPLFKLYDDVTTAVNSF